MMQIKTFSSMANIFINLSILYNTNMSQLTGIQNKTLLDRSRSLAFIWPDGWATGFQCFSAESQFGY